jgi:hypothetical protein
VSARAETLPVLAETAAESPPPPAPSMIDTLLADPVRLTDAADPASLARTLLYTIVGGAASFGAALGFFHGGWQTLFSAVKLPIVVLLTAMLATAARAGLSAALGRPRDPRPHLLLTLLVVARGCLVLAATTPVLLAAVCVNLSYNHAVLLAVLCCSVGGIAGLVPLIRVLAGEKRGRVMLLAGMALVLAWGGTQLSWAFRPYLVRPHASVALFRPLSGSFWQAVGESGQATMGGSNPGGYAP